MALTEGDGPVTSSYTGSTLCIPPPALFKAALIFALLLLMLIAITVMKIVALIIKAVAKKLIDVMYTVLVVAFGMPNASVVSELRVPWLSVGCKPSIGAVCVTRIGLLIFPAISPQQTVCTANMHMLPLVGTSVQRTVVWLVVVGQLPQFDEARML
jgi:hypothetical protein